MALRYEPDRFQRDTMVTLVHFCRNAFHQKTLGSWVLPAVPKFGWHRGSTTSDQVKLKMSAKSAESDETSGLSPLVRS